MNQAVLSPVPARGNIVRYAPGERDQRPWGTWEVLAVGPSYTLKRIEVFAGQRLSLQYHEFRSEHWTIVEGCAEVEVDGRLRRVEAGDHVFIPLRATHRIRNVGAGRLTFVEVQTGEVLDEDDIVRLVDDYGRA
ncbi:MAG TPA: phosphomannose isomerase type II C-terminal cupin domain [Beijerinckiaceae bacterium]|nr:phosphomannose isomerase type II C-terminal cupin domain [Beijerinckiaceae bacterium]